MRIFNGTNSQIDLPLTGNIRLSIASKTPSKDFAPNNDFLALIVSTYDDKEIALIVGGPYELSMCSMIPAAAPLLVQTLDEAVARFTKTEEKVIPAVESNPAVKDGQVTDSPKEDQPATDDDTEDGPTTTTEGTVKKAKAKSSKKKEEE
jgi:hypothetical protein